MRQSLWREPCREPEGERAEGGVSFNPQSLNTFTVGDTVLERRPKHINIIIVLFFLPRKEWPPKNT